MEQLTKALDAIEVGIVDLNCAQGAFANVYKLLQGADGEREETEYLDMLNIVTEYLSLVMLKLDNALEAARVAAEAAR